MQHKGYVGVVELDEEAGIIHGRVIGLRDVITFQGETVAAARKAFEDSVDDYLAFCKERGEEPEKPYSGRLLVRVTPELHRALAGVAESRKQSMNSLIEAALVRAVESAIFTGSKKKVFSPTSRKRVAPEYLLYKVKVGELVPITGPIVEVDPAERGAIEADVLAYLHEYIQTKGGVSEPQNRVERRLGEIAAIHAQKAHESSTSEP